MIDFSNIIEWKTYKQEKPPIGVLILVFRAANKKYALCRREISCNVTTGVEEEDWVTQYGNCHEINEKDAWFWFPKYSTQVIYE